MEARKVRNRLIAALVFSILLIAAAGVLSAKIGAQADDLRHEAGHLDINLSMLKFQLDHLSAKRKP